MYRRFELVAQQPPDLAIEPINRTLNTNLNAFVLERLEGLHARGHHVGLDDLVPVTPAPGSGPAADRDDGLTGRSRERRSDPPGRNTPTRPRAPRPLHRSARATNENGSGRALPRSGPFPVVLRRGTVRTTRHEANVWTPRRAPAPTVAPRAQALHPNETNAPARISDPAGRLHICTTRIPSGREHHAPGRTGHSISWDGAGDGFASSVREFRPGGHGPMRVVASRSAWHRPRACGARSLERPRTRPSGFHSGDAFRDAMAVTIPWPPRWTPRDVVGPRGPSEPRRSRTPKPMGPLHAVIESIALIFTGIWLKAGLDVEEKAI